MINFLLFTLIILFGITNCEGRERCDNRICQNHGVCVFHAKPNQIKCTCIPTLYSGKNCATWIKKCDPNPCDGDKCIDYPGGYQCECAESRGGQNCQFKSNQQYYNPIVLYNPLVELDETRFVIVFFEKLPSLDMRFELTAEQSMMSIKFTYSSTFDSKFQDTTNLRRLAADYDIYDVGDVPALGGKYMVLMYQVVMTFEFKFNLKITNLASQATFYNFDFVVLSSGPLINFNVALLVPSVLWAIIVNKIL